MNTKENYLQEIILDIPQNGGTTVIHRNILYIL